MPPWNNIDEDASGLETWVIFVVVLAGCVCLGGVGASFYVFWWRKDDQQTVWIGKALGAGGGLATNRSTPTRSLASKEMGLALVFARLWDAGHGQPAKRVEIA